MKSKNKSLVGKPEFSRFTDSATVTQINESDIAEPHQIAQNASDQNSYGLSDLDLYLIGEGRHEKLWETLGANVIRDNDGKLLGTNFCVWAPNAQSISLIVRQQWMESKLAPTYAH